MKYMPAFHITKSSKKKKHRWSHHSESVRPMFDLTDIYYGQNPQVNVCNVAVGHTPP